MTQPTSILAYQALVATGKINGLRRLVLHVLAHSPSPLGQKECCVLTKHSNLPSITPRFAEMEKVNIIIQSGYKKCSVSKETVQAYVVNPTPPLHFVFPKQQKHPSKMTKAQYQDVLTDLTIFKAWAAAQNNVPRPGTLQFLQDLQHIVGCGKCARL